MRPLLRASAVATLLSRLAEAGPLLRDPVPLTEYYSRTLQGYKPLRWDEITPENAQRMVRVKNLQDSEFKELVRRGYPFIVDDCASESVLKDFPCSEYGKRWPNEHMRAEYTPGQQHIYLKDPTWYSEQKPTAKAEKHLSRGKPLSGPYIWHVKDETEDKQTKRDLMKLFPVPYFLNSSTLNANEARDSFEFWYVLENGGSQAHADAYCETTISLQLRGTKTWRLGAFPNITNAFQPWSYHDAMIYGDDNWWQPEHQELVGPGQCVVFPMGYIHETYIPEGSGGEDGCSVATTFQFQDPQPVHLWRNFLTRWGLSHYSREEPCLERMEPYVYLGPAFGARGDRELSLRASCRSNFVALDADGDGGLVLGELRKPFTQMPYRPPWTEVRKREVFDMAAEEKMDWMAEDALLFHDDDKDGRVTLEEYISSVLKFDAVNQRLKAIMKLEKEPKKLLKRERKWIRDHLCESDECSYLHQLEQDAAEPRKEL